MEHHKKITSRPGDFFGRLSLVCSACILKIAKVRAKNAPLVEPRLDVRVGFGAEARVRVHRHSVELAQRVHAFEQHHHQPAALNRLDRAREHLE